MSKSISDSTQAARSASSSLAPVYLIKLTFYSDRNAGTEHADSPFYISRDVLTYDYDNGGTNQTFRPWLQQIGSLQSSIIYMPTGSDSGITDRSITIDLENGNYGGSRVAAILRGYNIEGAQIEVSELLLDSQSKPPIDLTAYTGNEHVVFFRGVVSRMMVSNSTVTLDCRTEMPRYSWPLISDQSQAAQKDVGFRYPIVYGSGVEVLCPALIEGAVTTLSEDVADSGGPTVSVLDASRFPTSGTYQMRIGTEEMDAQYSSATAIDIDTRGVNGTTAKAHKAGDVIKHMVSEAIYVVSAYRVSAVNSLMVRSPLTGNLVQLSSSWYTVDTNYPDPVGGGVISVIRISQANMRSILAQIAGQAAAVSDSSLQSDQTQKPTSGSTNIIDCNIDTTKNLAAGNEATQTFTAISGVTYSGQRIDFHVTASTWSGGSFVVKCGSTTIYSQGTSSSMAAGWHTIFTTDTSDTVNFNMLGPSSGSVNIQACRRTVYFTADPATTLSAGDIGYDLELYANVDGIVVPLVYTSAHAFDDSGTWNTLNCSQSRDTSNKAEGTASRKVTIDATDYAAGLATEWISTDSTTDWSVNSGTFGVETGEGHRTDSGTTGCMRATSNGSGAAYLEFNGGFGHTDADISEGSTGRGLIAFDFKIKKDTDSADIIFRFGNGTSNYYVWTVAQSEFSEDTWVTLIFDWTQADSETGSVTESAMDYMRVTFGAGSSTPSIYLDNIVTFQNLHRIQNNAMGSIDLSASLDEYSAQFYLASPGTVGSTIGDIDPMIYFSDTTGSGTTPPSTRRELDFTSGFLQVDTWVQLPATVTDVTATPTLTAIATMGVDLISQMLGVYSRDPIFVFNIDDLEVDYETGNPFEDTMLSVIEQSPDVARHWVSTVGGETVDETTFGTAATNLGTNVLAGDARGWGLEWVEVAGHIAFLSRANLVTEETSGASGATKWKMLTAESDYGWPATGGTLDQFLPENFSEGGRDERTELYSSRTFLYDYRPSKGNGDEAFVGIMRILTDQNDSGGKVSTATINAALAAFGSSEHPITPLLGINDASTAQEIGGYYYTEGARIAGLFVIDGLSWSQGYALEVGDIRDFERPWDSGTTIKGRVIEVVKSFENELVDVRLVEVT